MPALSPLTDTHTHPRSHPSSPEELESLVSNLREKLTSMRAYVARSGFFAGLVKEVRARVGPGGCVGELVCWGLGSVGDMDAPPMYQLACAELLREALGVRDCAAFKPSPASSICPSPPACCS